MTDFKEQAMLKIEAVAEELKQQMLVEFETILSLDFNELEKNLNQFSASANKQIFNESQKGLKQLIKQQFGDSIFGNILTDAILPTIFKGFDGGRLRSNGFNAASGQKFLEISKAISRAQSRNG